MLSTAFGSCARRAFYGHGAQRYAICCLAVLIWAATFVPQCVAEDPGVVRVNHVQDNLGTHLNQSVSADIDRLETDLAAITDDVPNPSDLAAIEADAYELLQRATANSDRSRANLLLYRVGRLAGRGQLRAVNGGQFQGAPSGQGSPQHSGAEVSLAQYTAPPGAVSTDMDPDATWSQQSGIAGDPCCAVPATCTPPPTRHYIAVDALGWWVKSDHLPPLVTTSPVGTPQAIAGVLGEPTTSILFGDQGVNGGIRPGARVQGGIWVDPFQSFAVEGHYYGLVTETTKFSASSIFSTGSLVDPILATPFFDAAPAVNAPRSVLTAFPNFGAPPIVMDIDGSISIKESSSIQSAGGGGRMSLNAYTDPTRLFFLAAYRYFNLDESLLIRRSSNPGVDPFPFPTPPGRIDNFDQFLTNNVFNGGELGLAAEIVQFGWSLTADTRLALGNMHQTVSIDGRTSAISGGYVASYPGGVFAQPTNMGSFSRNRFALIPQLDLKLGYQLLPALRLTVGYNFTYVTNVLRPGGQIDTTVNTTQIAGLPLVGPARPMVTFDETGIWLQGITAGLDLRF